MLEKYFNKYINKNKKTQTFRTY